MHLDQSADDPEINLAYLKIRTWSLVLKHVGVVKFASRSYQLWDFCDIWTSEASHFNKKIDKG